MRHLGANFFRQFKNKNLMNMFKRLCGQNQQQKFDVLWKTLDELMKKQTQECVWRPMRGPKDEPIPLESLLTDNEVGITRRTVSSIRSFSERIENELKQKWALLYDTNGARYDIMTINLAEVYNWVMKGVRGLPLVGIVEFIL